MGRRHPLLRESTCARGPGPRTLPLDAALAGDPGREAHKHRAHVGETGPYGERFDRRFGGGVSPYAAAEPGAGALASSGDSAGGPQRAHIDLPAD